MGKFSLDLARREWRDSFRWQSNADGAEMMMSFEAFVFSLSVIWITIVASWLFMIAISPPHLARHDSRDGATHYPPNRNRTTRHF